MFMRLFYATVPKGIEITTFYIWMFVKLDVDTGRTTCFLIVAYFFLEVRDLA